ncbi:MAG: GyrI-like domain-containing protein [Candidatus Eiseniibacteriota bacterium]|nr:MAG: GyrI-like domain-containing protein [Candidatus Eisenbacteria bacterium]
MMKSRGFQIVKLSPMTVVSAHALGVSPESEAWDLLCAWAEPRGLLEGNELHPIYGFNNPNPEPGSQEYGYEFWMVVDDSFTDSGQLKLKKFPGGLFAVSRCKLVGDSDGTVPEIWRDLYEKVKASGTHCWRRAQELEKLVNPGAPADELLLDLYLPVVETSSGG